MCILPFKELNHEPATHMGVAVEGERKAILRVGHMTLVQARTNSRSVRFGGCPKGM